MAGWPNGGDRSQVYVVSMLSRTPNSVTMPTSPAHSSPNCGDRAYAGPSVFRLWAAHPPGQPPCEVDATAGRDGLDVIERRPAEWDLDCEVVLAIGDLDAGDDALAEALAARGGTPRA